MCILFIAIGQHPDYPLIIAANRDEFHARPSQPAHEWPDKPEILAGRDSQAGGTWLGLNRRGQFAAVTNFRTPNPPQTDALSRGELVVKALTEEKTFNHYLEQNHQRYNPFNLVFGDRSSLNAWDWRAGACRTLTPGFHSVSNGPIDEYWPKMAHGVARISALISQKGDLDPDILVDLMQDQTLAPAESLPDTGISLERERALSSIFIEGDHYGTRASTVLLFGRRVIHLAETNYAPDKAVISSSKHVLRPC